jgi:hypothetical protein
MAPSKFSPRNALAWCLSLVLVALYIAMPEDGPGHGDAPPHGSLSEPGQPEAERDDPEVDPTRVDVLTVSPHEPYPGSTIAISHSETPHALGAYAGKTALRVLARRPGEMVAELPRDVLPGDLKIRVATTEAKSFSARKAHSKAFHVRVRARDYKKVFRNLIGGLALMLFGIQLLSRGVRESTGLSGARLLTRVSERRGFVLGFGALLGAVALSTTGVAGILAGFVSAGVLGLAPAAVAFLAAPLGAALVPIAVTGLVEPREGLMAVAIGVVWLSLANNRRAHASARLLLGAGFVAFGLQTFRPGLEPFLSDALLWSLIEHLQAPDLGRLALCACFGALAVAVLQGPAPLIVLVLGVAQTSGQWELRTLLAILSGTGLGAALAGLVTSPTGPKSRALAWLNLWLGALASLLCFLGLDLWVAISEGLVGPLVSPFHWSTRIPMPELGLRLALGFFASQLVSAVLLSLGVPRVLQWLDHQREARQRPPAVAESLTSELRATLGAALAQQQAGLGSVVALALTGVRRYGDEAEQALGEGRSAIERVLAGPVRELPAHEDTAGLAGAAFAILQLQNALDFLLRTTERMIDGRISSGDSASGTLDWNDETLLRSLHRLISEGLDEARTSLRQQEPVDLDLARTREIQINRLEASARGALLDVERARGLNENHMHVLEVIGAYEVSGNHVYRLAEILGQSSQVPHLASA